MIDKRAARSQVETPLPPPPQAEEWTQVAPRKRKKDKEKGKKRSATVGKEQGKSQNQGKSRRPPRTAAVVITGNSENFSYAETVKKARDQIALPELGIQGSKTRRAANGGLMIEIPGPDGPTKAETLKQKLVEVIGDVATVSRPVRKGEFRILGLDDSITEQEVVEVVAETGDCAVKDVKVGQLRKMSNGMFAIWAQCPLAAAIKITKPGKVRIGWTVAKVELLKARPLQC